MLLAGMQSANAMNVDAFMYIYANADKNDIIVTTLRKLANAFSWNQVRVLRFLNYLQDEGFILFIPSTNNTTIKIVDYGMSETRTKKATIKTLMMYCVVL